MFRHLCTVGLRLSSSGQAIKNSRHVMVPWRAFNSEISAGWPEAIKDFLAKENIQHPTTIQEKTLPVAMTNKDLVGIARTGSGKTLAFVIPAVMKILEEHKEGRLKRSHGLLDDTDEGILPNKPTCLVVAPTRELASQTADVFKKFNTLGFRSLAVVGGNSRADQIRQLQSRTFEVLIATPGRLLDLVYDDIVDLSQVKYLVLDEADRMLDMGFEKDLRAMFKRLPDQRQTLMWSATWPQEIRSLAKEYMKDFEQIQIDSGELKANPNIDQLVEVCSSGERTKKLLKYLKSIQENCDQPRTLIFVKTKRFADQLLLHLMRNKFRAVCMHGDRTQFQREKALSLFKSKYCNIMVATDVAARGLDIDDITHVINYDFPSCIEDYIHRIGRTARHDKKGTSLSFLTADEAIIAPKLIKVLKESNQPVPPELETLVTSFSKFHDFPRSKIGFQKKRRAYQDLLDFEH